jgi:hypothetical protein
MARVMLRTERTALRGIWGLLHRVVIRALVLLLRGPAATAYVRGAFGYGRPVFGLSDIDLAIVVSSDPRRPGAQRLRVRRRWNSLTGRAPGLADLVSLGVYEDPELEDAARATFLTANLDPKHRQGPSSGPLFGPGRYQDDLWLRVRPGIYGAATDWRRVAGPERREALAPLDEQDRRIAVWLDLQYWWRQAMVHAIRPSRHTVSLCVKLVGEPARMLLRLRSGARFDDRLEALEQARALFPDHQAAFRWALDLDRALPRVGSAPISDALEHLATLSTAVARELERELDGVGRTNVELAGSAEPLLSVEARRRGALIRNGHSAGDPLPLADWRAVVLPDLPDEAMIPIELQVGDIRGIARIARRAGCGPYPALRHAGILVLPTEEPWRRGLLRGVQCPITDPVSFALLDGSRMASFPEVRGWSVGDWCRRALAEHAERLRWTGPAQPVAELALLLSAVRAAVLYESFCAGRPRLPLTLESLPGEVAESHPGVEPFVSEGLERYRAVLGGGPLPDQGTVGSLRQAVLAMDPFSEAEEDRGQAQSPAGGGRPESGA